MIKKMILAALVVVFITSCDVKQTKETKLPDVDVDVDAEAGQLPSFDIDWADVTVGTSTKTVKIPKVIVVMEEVEVEIPYLDVDMPNSGEKEEYSVMVEAEVSGKEHNLDITEIWATGNKLFVISKLEEKTQTLGDKKMRISDQVKLNAPDLDVKHYIIGEKPDRFFNGQYKYIKSTEALKAKLGDKVKVIYSK